MFLFVVIAIAAFTYLLTWYLNRDLSEKLKHVCEPKSLPLVGNALDLYKTDIVLPTLCRYQKEFGGKLVKVKIGSFRTLLIAFDYDFVEAAFMSTRNIGKSVDYNQLHNWLGTGLLTSTGAKWQKRRKLLTPAFHFQILDNFVDVFHRQSDVLVEKLSKELNKNIDIYNFITLSSLDIICESAMGTSINAQSDKDSIYVQCVKDMGKIVMARATHPLKFYDFFYKLSNDYKRELKALKVLHGTTDDIIKKRREAIANEKVTSEANEDGIKKRLAFLDLLLNTKTAEGEYLSDADIREEVDTFMFEGHDTTASGITFTLYMLAKHQDVQKKVYEELQEIFPDKESAATLKDLQNMKYLELVISESLRLYPSVPIIGREFSEDMLFDGHVYPKGLNVLIPAYCLHRNEKFFKNAEEFRPERFSLENKADRKPFSYFPFSAGPRNCIGQKFAMLELKSVVSKVIRHFRLKEVPDFEPHLSSEAILKSMNGVHVILEKRE